MFFLQNFERQREDIMMFEWFNEHGYDPDIEALQNEHNIETADLETYLSKNNWVQ